MTKFISVHIPKTGGGTFKEVLKKLYGNKVLFDYNKIPFDQDWEEKEIIHGHFTANKYSWTDRPMICWFREPIQRIISHYQYKRMLNHDEFSKDIVTFAKRIRNTQTIFTCSNLDRFDAIFFTDDYLNELKRFEKWAGVKIDFTVPRINRSNKLRISDDERKIIAELNKEDIELYNRALDKFRK